MSPVRIWSGPLFCASRPVVKMRPCQKPFLLRKKRLWKTQKGCDPGSNCGKLTALSHRKSRLAHFLFRIFFVFHNSFISHNNVDRNIMLFSWNLVNNLEIKGKADLYCFWNFFQKFVIESESITQPVSFFVKSNSWH